MKLNLQATPIFLKTRESKARIVINEGSSRSSKTYSLCQFLFLKLLEEKNIVITVARKTLPALKATAYKDFLDIVNKNGVYSPDNHNKSDLTYKIGTNEIEFISVDNYNKVKGRKRDYLFCNEMNELSKDDFVQLSIRTTKQIFGDYNPSHNEYHWIETDIKTRDDVEIIKSTYKDNPFNGEETIREIERLKEADPNLWRIYGLGLMGLASSRIYNHFELIDEMPENGETFYGLDFGYNHPTALVEIKELDDAFYINELVYSSGLTNNDLIAKMSQLGVNKNKFMFCDSAEPQRIEEIRRAGYNAYSSDKDVKKGIDTVKSKKVFITKRSVDTIKESRGYSWKTTADGKILDEPVRINDDSMSACRYGIHTYLTQKAKQPNIRSL
jgi:phage terminase large subunit